MGKNFTDLTPADVTRIIEGHFAGRSRRVVDVSFGVVQEFTPRDEPTGGYCLQSVRVTWEDEPPEPAELNPRTE